MISFNVDSSVRMYVHPPDELRTHPAVMEIRSPPTTFQFLLSIAGASREDGIGVGTCGRTRNKVFFRQPTPKTAAV